MARTSGDPQIPLRQISVPIFSVLSVIVTAVVCVWYLSGILGEIQTTLAVAAEAVGNLEGRVEDLEAWRSRHDPSN